MTTDRRTKYLAENERTAEQVRDAATTQWRAAWWVMTMHLAEDRPKAAQTAVYDTAAAELGQSRQYLQRRASVGRRLGRVDGDDLTALAPEQASRVVLHTDLRDYEVVQYLADHPDASVRELLADVGGPSPDRQPDLAEQLTKASPAQLTEAMGTLTGTDRLKVTNAAQRAAPVAPTPQPSPLADGLADREAESLILANLTTLAAAADRLHQLDAPDGELRKTAVARLTDVRRQLALLHQVWTDGTLSDDDLMALLNGGA